MTRAQVRANVRANLSDAGITTYSDADLNDSIQDAYNEISVNCLTILKSASIQQLAAKNYYDFLALGITDYLGYVAIFNQDTNLWLRDDINIRDFDRMRRDWENWQGEPQFVAPHSLQYVAIAPYQLITGPGNVFTVWYWGFAPTLVTDSDTFLIATDQQYMLEAYTTADSLEVSEEVAKAAPFWMEYSKNIELLRARNLDRAMAQLLLRI